MIVDVATLQSEPEISSMPKCLGLLESAAGTNVIYAAGENRIFGWDVRDGRQVVDVRLKLPASEAATRLRTWRIHDEGSDWLMIYSAGTVVRQPLNPVQYASALAPRQLSPAEQAKYLMGNQIAID